jgi:tetratricopeptide (TPR) repeat protein
MNDLDRKRTENLSDEGFACIGDGDFDRALEISIELEYQRFSAAFDIGAQAYTGLGEYEKAIETLKRGVKLAPNVWLNWQLLGNCLSDFDELDEARDAYECALKCENVWHDSVYLNQAILSNRSDNYSRALEQVKKVQDDELYFHKKEVEISALNGLSLFDDAIDVADKVFSLEDYAEDEEVVGRIAALVGRVYLKQGKTKNEVRDYAVKSLSYDSNSRMLLALIRDIDNKYSSTANYYRACIHCVVSVTSPDYHDIKGYYCNYDVVAESTEELLEFVKVFEDGVVEGGNYIIDEYEILEKNSEDPCGVYSRSGRSSYASIE